MYTCIHVNRYLNRTDHFGHARPAGINVYFSPPVEAGAAVETCALVTVESLGRDLWPN